MWPEIKAHFSRLSGGWKKSFDTESHCAEICQHDPLTGRIEPIARILPECPFDDQEFMLKAPTYVEALVVTLTEANRLLRIHLPKPPEEPRKKRTPAQACGALCKTADFRRWLHEVHGAETTDEERINSRVRSMLNIASRAELDTDSKARGRWASMRSDFYRWKDSGR